MLVAPALAWSGPAVAVDYWVWHPGVCVDRVLDRAGRLYLFQGELLVRGGEVRYGRRGFSPPHGAAPPLVLVYRCETLDWPVALYQRMERDLQRFAVRGNRIWGVQVDFDAATRHLDRYGDFLRRLRTELPLDYGVSVTGLLDWASQGQLEDMNSLQGVVDEVVFQAYQGRHPVADHARYLRRLAERGLTLPFKLGLVEGGDYDPWSLERVRHHPSYRGTVVFLLPVRRDGQCGRPSDS